MPEGAQKFKEYIKARQELGKKLANAGIPESEYIDLFNLLETVTGTYLEDARNSQFHDDANELGISIQSATNKNVAKIETYLRQFAEHIVRHACNIQDEAKIQSVVDRLPQITDAEETKE